MLRACFRTAIFQIGILVSAMDGTGGYTIYITLFLELRFFIV